VAKLESKFGQGILDDAFANLFDGVHGLQTFETELVQVNEHQAPIINKTNFTEPPKQRVEVPSNPCDGAPYPSAATKRAASCKLSKGNCYKLQERFLNIQAGMQDERDQLQDDIAQMEAFCDETRTTLETEISDAESMLSEAQTKLGKATEDVNNAMETARQTASLNADLDAKLKDEMKKCNDKYIGYEGEICALKKIRGELYKLKGGGHSAFFQDCEVSKWEPEECTVACAGGTQVITRKVLAGAKDGAECLGLEAIRSCNNQPCPVDCKLSAWSGWSKCSAECGGGLMQRLKEVKQAMKYKGVGCGKTKEAKQCNDQACEKDCELGDWTAWSECSKDCDGGTQKRQKFVKHAVEGEGSCPDQWAVERLEYKKCNQFGCPVAELNEPMLCNNSVDVVLLIDGSGSLGRRGWKAEQKMAEMFVDAFQTGGSESRANMAVILYSGPRTWSGVWKCTGKDTSGVDMERTCGIKTVTHFMHDMKAVHDKIAALNWPSGSTLTSLALMKAKAELSLGRKDAKSIVVVITDGRPLSFRNTGVAARQLRKTARLVWVPVTAYAPLKSIKSWATRRWEENVVQVETFDELQDSSVVTQVIADICPKPAPEEDKWGYAHWR